MARFLITRIDPPIWARRAEVDIESITLDDYNAVQRHRDEMLRVVQAEVESYLNEPWLSFDGEDGFPSRQRLTGEYYVGSEFYGAHREPAWIQIGIKCHCLEHPKAGVDRVDDYLGLEVWLRSVPDRPGEFEVFRNTDSSSI